MKINEAITKAIEGGYKMLGFADKPLFSWGVEKYWGGWLVCVRYGAFGEESTDTTKHIADKYNDFDIDKIFLDPLFWQFAFGKENGRMKALELFNYLFDGGTIEQYFEQMADLGEKQ